MITRILSFALIVTALNAYAAPATLTLEEAVRAGDIDAVIAVLDSGEDPDTKTAGGAPTLVLADGTGRWAEFA